MHGSVYIYKVDVSETGFCFHLQVDPAEVGPIDRTSLCLPFRHRDYLFLLGPSKEVSPEGGNRMQSPKRRNFDRTVNDVENCHSNVNIPSTQPCSSY
jgi:hypothetical protein